MSRTEWRLWYHLRQRQIGGLKFRRQVPLLGFVVDFACLPRKLVVEVDGDHHAFQVEYDRRRDGALEAAGYRVLRFWATDLDSSLEGVLDEIERVAESRKALCERADGVTA